MATGKAQELIAKLNTGFESKSNSRNNVESSKDFFEDESSYEEIIALFDRKEYNDKLKTLETQKHLVKETVAAKCPIEFMTGLQRDTVALFTTRLDNYRSSSLSSKMPKLFFSKYTEFLDKLESK